MAKYQRTANISAARRRCSRQQRNRERHANIRRGGAALRIAALPAAPAMPALRTRRKAIKENGVKRKSIGDSQPAGGVSANRNNNRRKGFSWHRRRKLASSVAEANMASAIARRIEGAQPMAAYGGVMAK